MKTQIDNISNPDSLTIQYEAFTTKMIICDFSARNFNEFKRSFKNDLKENDWLILNLSHEPTRFSVEVYPEDFESTQEPLDSYLASNCKKVNRRIQKKLDKIFALKASEIELTKYVRDLKLNNLAKPKEDRYRSIKDIIVHDVGQGNFISIMGENDIPLAYFDVGGGAYRNAHTYPANKTKTICPAKDLFIVLSHWHNDHWWSFKRQLKNHPTWEVPKATWIVPDQKFGPGQKNFNELLLKNHQILIKWPKRKKSESFHFGTIIKCTAPEGNENKNHNGLALLVKNSKYRVLLPGDAAYDSIDPKYVGEITGLVATHHGGSYSIVNELIPAATSSLGKIVYSYGAGNTYHHPSGASVINHYQNGWSDIRVTPSGSVSFMATAAQIYLHNVTSKFGLGSDCDHVIKQGF